MLQTPDGLMAHALALTRAGRLQDATAALLGGLQPGASARAATDVIDVLARVVDDPRPASAGGASATGTASFSTGEHSCAAGSRAWRLSLPPATPGVARPLLVMLHGCQQDSADFARGTGMDALAALAGMAVLYPEQAAGQNPQRCWNWFKHNHQQAGRGEPAILADMVHATVQRHGLDARRVCVAGLSAGGAMAAILGAACPGVFAAVGVHSGLPAGAAHDLPSALAAMQGKGPALAQAGAMPPTIVIHGDQDGTVAAVNGQRVLLAAARGLPATVRTLNSGGRRCTVTQHRAADGTQRAEHWLVDGAGHAWQGGQAGGSFTDRQGPDASAAMLAFFAQHALPA